MNVPFIDLAAQQKRIRGDLDRRIARVLDHGQFILGPEIEELEKTMASFVGVKHAIGVSSGTDALLIALMALGIKAGDEIVTTPFTFMATGEMIALLGAKPVFADINPKTYNLCPRAAEKAITSKTKAIVPVSLYGQCADFDAFNELGKKWGLPIIEDAAQSFGALYKNKRSCGLSEISCTSFFPSKPLGGYGDGGACFTNDDRLAKLMREVLNHGQERRYYHTRIGINGRLDTLQAAILLAKWPLLTEELATRDRIGKRYSQLIREKVGAKVNVPHIENWNTSAYAQYTVQIVGGPAVREKVQASLQKNGIPTSVHYPVPLNLQPAFAEMKIGLGSFPEADKASQSVLSLPMDAYLTEERQNYVVEKLAETFGQI